MSVVENIKEKIKKFESCIDPDKKYNKNNESGTVGEGINNACANVHIIGTLLNLLKKEKDNPEKLSELEEMEHAMDKLLQYTPLFVEAYKNNPEANLEDILAPEEYERFVKLASKWTYVKVSDTRLIDLERVMEDMGIPYCKAVDDVGNTFVYTSSDYTKKLQAAKRISAIEQKMGLSSIEEFDSNNLDSVKMQLLDIEDWKAEIINSLMKRDHISGGIAKNNSDIENQKVNIVIRQRDELKFKKIMLEAELLSSAAIDPMSDIIIKNKFQGIAKDKRLVENVINHSLYTDFYLCSEKVDKYIEINKDGFTLYRKGQPVHKVDRNKLSEEDFYKEYYEYVTQVSSHGLVVFNGTELKENREETLNRMKTQKGRIQLMEELGKASSTVDIPYYSSSAMNALARDDRKSSDVILDEAAKDTTRGHGAFFVLKAMEKHMENENRPTSLLAMDFLDNNNGTPSISVLIQRHIDHAKAYANNAEYEKWAHLPESERKGMYSDEQVNEIKENIIKTGKMLDETKKQLVSTFNLDEDTIKELSNGLAACCGATFDEKSNKIEYSENPKDVELKVRQLQQLKTKLINTCEELEKKPLVDRSATLEELINKDNEYSKEAIDKINDKLVKETEER